MVASYGIDTYGLKAERSQDVWREVVDGTYDLEHMSNAEGGHRVATRVWPVEDLLFSTLKAEANTVTRTQALISSNPTPIVKIRAYRYGKSQLTSESASCAYGTGAIHFFNHDFASRQTSTDHEQITVFVPYHAIDYDPAIHPNVFSIGLDTAAGRLLEASLNAAFLELDRLDKKETPAFVSSFMGTLRGALSGAVDSLADNDVRRARLSAMKRFIHLNLHDDTLNADRLMSVFSLSRATLFRDFAEIGGINRYITTCRIQRAYRDLTEAVPSRGLVQSISERWGFSSLAYFSRTFKDHYGVPPTSVLGAWAEKGDVNSGEASSGSLEKPTFDYASIAAVQWGYGRFK